MRRWKLGIALFSLGCGGAVDPSRPAESNASGGGRGIAPDGASGNAGGGADSGPAPEGGVAGAGGTGGTYVDPGCPPLPPAGGTYECDALAAVTGCPAGLRCLPYVQYADDCGREVFGSRCTEAGTGVQGDSCFDASDCAARYVCVTTGEGNQCVQLCDPDNGSDDCPSGLLCWWLDVPGSNVCF